MAKAGRDLPGMQQHPRGAGLPPGIGLPPMMPGVTGMPGLGTPYLHPTPIETGPPGHISRTQEWPRRDQGHRWTTPWNPNGGTPTGQNSVSSTPASAALRNSPLDQSEEAESSKIGAGRTPNGSRSVSMNSQAKPE